MIQEAAIARVIEKTSDLILNKIVQKVPDLASSDVEVQEAVSQHLRAVANFASGISFKALAATRDTTEVFVELDLSVTPRSGRFTADEVAQSRPLLTAVSESLHHVVLLGQPGSGKTTSIKYVALQMLNDDTFRADRNFPLLVTLRDLSRRGLLLSEYIFSTLGLKEMPPTVMEKLPRLPKLTGRPTVDQRVERRRRLLLSVLAELKPFILIDGLDEISDYALRSRVLADVSRFANELDGCQMMLTSRTGEFLVHIENTQTYELEPLSDAKTTVFVEKWLQDDPAKFLEALRLAPYADVARRPLMLAHLCTIFQRHGAIPFRPQEIYWQVVMTLLEKWDEERSIHRRSRFPDFSIIQKYDFLAALAFRLTTETAGALFDRRQIDSAFEDVRGAFSLEMARSEDVMNELEAQTGLVVRASMDLFEFAHRSIQEYLAATHLVRLPQIPDRPLLKMLPNELAIAVTLSQPNRYFGDLVLRHLQGWEISREFLAAFASRLRTERPMLRPDERVWFASLVLHSQIAQWVKLDAGACKVGDAENRAIQSDFDATLSLCRSLEPASGWDMLATFYDLEAKRRNDLEIFEINRRAGRLKTRVVPGEKGSTVRIDQDEMPELLCLHRSLFTRSSRQFLT